MELNADCLGAVIKMCDSITRGVFSAVSRETAAIAARFNKYGELGSRQFCNCHVIIGTYNYMAVIYASEDYNADFYVYAGMIVKPSQHRQFHKTVKTVKQDVRDFLTSHDITPAEFYKFVHTVLN